MKLSKNLLLLALFAINLDINAQDGDVEKRSRSFDSYTEPEKSAEFEELLKSMPGKGPSSQPPAPASDGTAGIVGSGLSGSGTNQTEQALDMLKRQSPDLAEALKKTLETTKRDLRIHKNRSSKRFEQVQNLQAKLTELLRKNESNEQEIRSLKEKSSNSKNVELLNDAYKEQKELKNGMAKLQKQMEQLLAKADVNGAARYDKNTNDNPYDADSEVEFPTRRSSSAGSQTGTLTRADGSVQTDEIGTLTSADGSVQNDDMDVGVAAESNDAASSAVLRDLNAQRRASAPPPAQPLVDNTVATSAEASQTWGTVKSFPKGPVVNPAYFEDWNSSGAKPGALNPAQPLAASSGDDSEQSGMITPRSSSSSVLREQPPAIKPKNKEYEPSSRSSTPPPFPNIEEIIVPSVSDPVREAAAARKLSFQSEDFPIRDEKAAGDVATSVPLAASSRLLRVVDSTDKSAVAYNRDDALSDERKTPPAQATEVATPQTQPRVLTQEQALAKDELLAWATKMEERIKQNNFSESNKGKLITGLQKMKALYAKLSGEQANLGQEKEIDERSNIKAIKLALRAMVELINTWKEKNPTTTIKTKVVSSSDDDDLVEISVGSNTSPVKTEQSSSRATPSRDPLAASDGREEVSSEVSTDVSAALPASASSQETTKAVKKSKKSSEVSTDVSAALPASASSQETTKAVKKSKNQKKRERAAAKQDKERAGLIQNIRELEKELLLSTNDIGNLDEMGVEQLKQKKKSMEKALEINNTLDSNSAAELRAKKPKKSSVDTTSPGSVAQLIAKFGGSASVKPTTSEATAASSKEEKPASVKPAVAEAAAASPKDEKPQTDTLDAETYAKVAKLVNDSAGKIMRDKLETIIKTDKRKTKKEQIKYISDSIAILKDSQAKEDLKKEVEEILGVKL